MLNLYTEGKAKLYASGGPLSAKTPVFYNPVMKLNRDVAVWIVGKLKPKSLCLGMEASGARALRMALESNAGNIVANDASKTCFETMQKNVALNNVADKIKIENKDIKKLLSEGEKYDYIDIDPFGTPVYYASSAISSLAINGVLAVTATDTSCLCGRYVNACIKKYGSRPLNNEFNKETAVRILVRAMQDIAAKQGKALVPIFIHSSNHYVRAYLRFTGDCSRNISSNQGFILYCPKCLDRRVSNSPKGLCCGRQMDYAGPLWLGDLWDKDLLEDFSLIPYICAESEIHIPWHFDSHRIAKISGKDAIKQEKVIAALQNAGFKASRTHFKPEGIKTNASIKDISAVF